jgi:hypothetical protein
MKNTVSLAKSGHRAIDDFCQHCMGSGGKDIIHFVADSVHCPFFGHTTHKTKKQNKFMRNSEKSLKKKFLIQKIEKKKKTFLKQK